MTTRRWVLAAALVALTPAAPLTALAAHTNFDEAVAAARAENKLLLVDFWTDWCGPCKTFNKDSVEDPGTREAVARFVIVKIDAEKGEGIELAKRFTVRNYPTYVVLNTDEEVTARWFGYERNMFIEEADRAIADPTTIDEKRARYEADPNLQDALTLSTYHNTRQEPAEALAYMHAAAKMDPETSYSYDILDATYLGFRHGKVEPGQVVEAAEDAFADERMEALELLYAASMMYGVQKRSENPGLAEPYFATAFERTADSTEEDVVARREKMGPDHALLVEKDEAKAIRLKKAQLPDGWVQDPNQLNGFAWWCFESNVNLEEARELALEAVSLAEPGSERGNILDTLAEICNATGNCGDALAYINQAIEENPGREYFRKQQKRFAALVAEQEYEKKGGM